jgi:hypothetical protein
MDLAIIKEGKNERNIVMAGSVEIKWDDYTWIKTYRSFGILVSRLDEYFYWYYYRSFDEWDDRISYHGSDGTYQFPPNNNFSIQNAQHIYCGYPFPNKKLIFLLASKDNLKYYDKDFLLQFTDEDLGVVTAGVLADINNDGKDEIILAQLVDEKGNPNRELWTVLENRDKKTKVNPDSVLSQLLLLEWSEQNLCFEVVSRSNLFKGERIWDIEYFDADADGNSELIVLTGPVILEDNGSSSIYHVNVKL